jgi:hypothetical protein
LVFCPQANSESRKRPTVASVLVAAKAKTTANQAFACLSIRLNLAEELLQSSQSYCAEALKWRILNGFAM